MGISFGGIGFKGFVKWKIKRKWVGDMLVKKGCVVLGGKKIGVNLGVSCNVGDYVGVFVEFVWGDKVGCMKKMWYCVGYLKFWGGCG